MSRIRTIKPEFWTSEQVVKCSLGARLLFIGLWNFCDDAGIHPASACRIKMEVFPGDNFTTEEIESWIKELVDIGLLWRYTVDGTAYLQVTGWHHQRIEKPTFKYPGLKQESKFVDYSSTSRRLVDDHSTTTPGPLVHGGEGNGRDLDLDHRGGEDLTHCTAPPPPLPQKKLAKKAKETSLDNLGISEEVRQWAEKHRYDDLETHLQVFKLKVRASGRRYADLDAEFMVAIHEDWAKLRQPKRGSNGRRHVHIHTRPTHDESMNGKGPPQPPLFQGGQFVGV